MQQVSAAMNLLRTRLLFPAVEVDGDYNAPASDGRVVVNAVSLASTKFLLQSDNADGSQVFADTSPSEHALSTGIGNTRHSTAKKKFGASSIYFEDFDGGDIRSLNNSDEFNPYDGDFTLHGWIKSDVSATNGGVVKLGEQTSTLYYKWEAYTAGDKINFQYKSAAGNGSIIGTISCPNYGVSGDPDAFDHWCVMRNGPVLYLFINGVVDGTDAIGVKSIDASGTYKLIVGRRSGSVYFDGYMDEVQWIKGVAAFPTTGFTPPTAPNFKAPGDATVILPVGTQGLRRQTQKGDTGIGNVIIKDSDLNILRTLTAYRELSDLKFDSGSWVTK